MSLKKIISVFLVAVSTVSMSGVCCHAMDSSTKPELVELCSGFSADDKCKLNDEKNKADDKDDFSKSDKEDKDDDEKKGE